MQQNVMKKTSQFRFIEKESDLETVTGKLGAEKFIAADVEADSMFSFREKVCLVQIASEKYNFVIDTVKIRDLSLLKPIFLNQKIQKVFHGADFDVRSLFVISVLQSTAFLILNWPVDLWVSGKPVLILF